jgi:hypothetical protein
MAIEQEAIAGLVAVTMPPLAKFITVVIIAKLELAAKL